MKYDLIIIGAGPAGVSAAVYAARQKLSIAILAKTFGGQVAKKAVDIENYPGFEKISGPDLVDLYQKQLEAQGLEAMLEEVTGIKKDGAVFSVATQSGKIFEATAVILASGAESRLLGITGEEQFSGKGVSYCSLCDGPIYKDKTVAVVGGGNNGFESAMFLSNYVKKIYILEYSDTIRADKENQEHVAKNSHIEVIMNAKLEKIEGEQFVTSLTYQDLKTNEEKKLDVQGIFVEIGYSPATEFAKVLVELNEKREIIFDPKTLETKTPGLFSAGDCNQSKYKQIIMASGQGAVAALSAYEYIKKQK